ncbi:MAG TPA: ribonuclease P [Methanocorpusculum sp.]|nr:ribonuclease P [Methanocorpusculum sp.]
MIPLKICQDPKEIAIERISILFSQAYINRANPTLARRYVILAREIAMRRCIRIPKVYRRSFCPVCYTYFVSGENHRVRIQHGKVISTCRICGVIIRYPLL